MLAASDTTAHSRTSPAQKPRRSVLAIYGSELPTICFCSNPARTRSTRRVEYPHSLSYHVMSFTKVGVSMMPAPASNTVEHTSPTKSDDTTSRKARRRADHVLRYDQMACQLHSRDATRSRHSPFPQMRCCAVRFHCMHLVLRVADDTCPREHPWQIAFSLEDCDGFPLNAPRQHCYKLLAELRSPQRPEVGCGGQSHPCLLPATRASPRP